MTPRTKAKGLPPHVEKFIADHGLRVVITPYVLDHEVVVEDDERHGIINLEAGKCVLWPKPEMIEMYFRPKLEAPKDLGFELRYLDPVVNRKITGFIV